MMTSNKTSRRILLSSFWLTAMIRLDWNFGKIYERGLQIEN
jgi:hypothetical protein